MSFETVFVCLHVRLICALNYYLLTYLLRLRTYLLCYILVWQVSRAKDQCDMARDDAEMAYERAEFAKNQSVTIHSELQSLIVIISEFLEQLGARPEDIRTVCVLDLCLDDLLPDYPSQRCVLSSLIKRILYCGIQSAKAIIGSPTERPTAG